MSIGVAGDALRSSPTPCMSSITYAVRERRGSVVDEAKREAKGRGKAKCEHLVPRRLASWLPSSWRKLRPPSRTLPSSSRCGPFKKLESLATYRSTSEPRGAVLEQNCPHRYRSKSEIPDDRRAQGALRSTNLANQAMGSLGWFRFPIDRTNLLPKKG